MPRSPRYVPLILLFAVVLIVAGCGKSTEQAQQTAAPAAPKIDTAAHMKDHFTKVREIEEAIIRGDLEAAKEPAQWMADHQEVGGYGARADQRIMELKSAAKSVAAAKDIDGAAQAAAGMAGACGHCHSAANVAPKLPKVPDDEKGVERVRHMMEHQHAIDHMYYGLISPTTGDWMTGAEKLKAAPLRAKAMKDVNPEVLAAEARVHELADRALGASVQSSRVAIYGSLIGSCANCHGLHGHIWGPGPKAN